MNWISNIYSSSAAFYLCYRLNYTKGQVKLIAKSENTVDSDKCWN